MRILVDCIPYDDNKSGISVYTRNVVRELSSAGHDLLLLLEPGAERFFPGLAFRLAPAWAAAPWRSMLWHLFCLPWQLRKKEFDFLLLTAANRRALSFYPLPTIAVVHDLAQYHIPGKYSRLRMFYLKYLLPFFVRRATQAVAVSQSTAADLETYWKIPRSRTAVCYNGLSPLPRGRGDWCATQRLEKKKYILYVSRLEHPGKNHLNLLAAYGMLPEELRREYSLVLAGSDWQEAEVIKAAAAALPQPGCVIFPGFVSSENLYEAYSQAKMYIFPSFFEGFGLSLIEAMACGCPCACANNSSLGEIGAGAAALFPPDQPAAMAAAMQEILTNQEYARGLVEAGRQRAAQFDWQKHAAAILQLGAKISEPHSQRQA